MALGLLSYLAIDRPVSKRPLPALSGVLAGLAALTHLNGLIYLIAGFGILLVQKRWRAACFFGLAGGFTLSLYLLDAVQDGNLSVMMLQFRDDPATQQNLNWTDKLAVMAGYHRVFFHSHNELALSALFMLCVIVFRKRIKRSAPIVVYTAILFFSFWVLTKSDTYMYFILFLPWLVILTADWIISYLPYQPVWERKVAQVLLVVYCLIALFQVNSIIVENNTSPDVEAQNALLSTHMPRRHTKVIAPIEFFFGQIDNYQIKGLTYYHLLERRQGAIPLKTFFQNADREEVEYIISDHRLNASYDIPPTAPDQIGVYKRVYQDQWNSLYSRQRNGR